MQDKINNTEDRREDIENLHHVERKFSWGGEVLVLQNGAVITAEDNAMLQALYSRDPKGVKSHLEKLAKSGSGNLMSSFYVGYGHESIGDCGNTTMFFSSISMLAAKAIQDFQLYNGQECSTRYIDFSNQPFFNPNTETGKNLEKNIITEKLRDFYLKAFPLTIEDLKIKNPKKDTEDEKVYEKAIKARAFDIMRGFLPAGATTGVAWSGNLRQVSSRIKMLRHHPLKEVREIAVSTLNALQEAHPNSFGHKMYEETENYNEEWMKNEYVLKEGTITGEDVHVLHDGIDKKHLDHYRNIIDNRPNSKTELPKQIGITGTANIAFLLDFGSWRDIQRHRAVIQLMPEVGVKYGFEKWYLENLPTSMQEEAINLLKEIETSIEGMDETEKQYFVPMGYKVQVNFSGDIPAMVYLAEIRSTSMVHATLQKKAIQLAKTIENNWGVKVFYDENDVGRFDSKRGTNDIVQKEL